MLKVLVPTGAAKELGIRENDEIIIEAPKNRVVRGKAHLSEFIHPQTIGVAGKWARRGTHMPEFAKDGTSYNYLINDTEEDIGFLMGNLNNSVCVRIRKA